MNLYVPIDDTYFAYDETKEESIDDCVAVAGQRAFSFPDFSSRNAKYHYNLSRAPWQQHVGLGVERAEPVGVQSYTAGKHTFGFMLPYSSPVLSAFNEDKLRYAEDVQKVNYHEHWHIFFPDEQLNRSQTSTTDLSLLSMREQYGP